MQNDFWVWSLVWPDCLKCYNRNWCGCLNRISHKYVDVGIKIVERYFTEWSILWSVGDVRKSKTEYSNAWLLSEQSVDSCLF